ncbi:MAG: hypothetical protein GX552_04345 [Chloroflexi bacterium]|nr:hypothetical protein [Chloroflexota bacterium]
MISLENLIDWLDGRLDEDSRAQVEEHLREGCEQCEADLSFLRRVLAAARAEPLIEPPAELTIKAKAIYRPPRQAPRFGWMSRRYGQQPAWVRPVLGLAAALFLVLTASLYVLGRPTVPVREAVVVPQDASLEVRQPEGTEWQPIQEEQPVQEGYRLRAADDSAVMTLFDGSSLEMRSSAEVELTTLREGVLGSAHHITIQQDAGYIVYRVASLPNARSAFRVQAPGALVTVRGTVFAVAVSPEGETLVSVLEGSVRVATESSQLDLAPGEGAVASIGGTLMPLPGATVTALAPAEGSPSPTMAATDTPVPTNTPTISAESPTQAPAPGETAASAGADAGADAHDVPPTSTLRPSLPITGTPPIPPKWQTVLPTILPQLPTRLARPTRPVPTAWPTVPRPSPWPWPTRRLTEIWPTIVATLWPPPMPSVTVEITPPMPPAGQSTPTPAPPGEPTAEATAPPAGWPTPPAVWQTVAPTVRPLLTLLPRQTPVPDAGPPIPPVPAPPVATPQVPAPPRPMPPLPAPPVEPEGPPWW